MTANFCRRYSIPHFSFIVVISFHSNSEPVRTLAWESVSPLKETDCHTSDIGHWFAMTDFDVLDVTQYKYILKKAPGTGAFGLFLIVLFLLGGLFVLPFGYVVAQ